MKRSAVGLIALLLATVAGSGEINPAKYVKISQCILVRERQSLVGEKVQLTGKFLEGSNFCETRRGINTKDYVCFALGKPCIIRLYLKKDNPQVDLLFSLKPGDELTAYGTFNYAGSDYNYVIVDAIAVPPKPSAAPAPKK